MRVLIVSIPQAGHLTPLIPLATALVAQGDDVLVASGADVADQAAGAGLRFATTGTGLGRWFQALSGRTRGQPGDGLPAGRIQHYFTPRLFAEIAVADMIDGVIEVGRSLRPDLVVYDSMAYAGPLAAAVLGVRDVEHTIGLRLEPDIDELAFDALSPLWRTFGLDVRAHAVASTIAICPPSLEEPLPGAVRMRPAPLPAGAPTTASRPLIYLTLGTFSNNDLGVFRTVLDGLADESVDVVATVGRDNDPDRLRPWPRNARVERFVPQADLLPGCTAVVHHGGSGTMFGALAHGLPQLVLPQSADNYVNAQAIARAGFGAQLLPDEATAEAVADGVRTLLTVPARQRATVAATEIAAMPAPTDIATLLRRHYG